MTGNLNNMKKLLFVLAFAFIGQQAFSQMYMIHIGGFGLSSTSGCNINHELTLTKVNCFIKQRIALESAHHFRKTYANPLHRTLA